VIKEAWRRIPPLYLFLWGLVLMVTYLFQTSLPVRAGETLAYVLLAVLTGRRFRLWPNLTVVAGVTLVHLISPLGRVMFTLGSWQITQGSLELGLFKGLMLVGLIYISRSFISPRLSLPGRAGALMGLTFAYFEALTESRGFFKPREPFQSTDQLLLRIWRDSEVGEGRRERVRYGFRPLWILPPLMAAGQLLLLFYFS